MQGIYYFQDGKVFHACREANSGDVITLCALKVQPTAGPVVMRDVEITCPKCRDILDFEHCQRSILLGLIIAVAVTGTLLLYLVDKL